MKLLNESVLVLNKYFLAIQVTTVREAIITLVSGKSRIIDENYLTYNLTSWHARSMELKQSGQLDKYPGVLRSPSTTLVVPYAIIIPDCEFNNPAIKTVKYSRRNLVKRDNYTCQYCKKKFDKKDLTVDHVTPRSKGGKSTWTNVVACCRPCNAIKQDKTIEELGWSLTKKPTQPRWKSHIGIPFNKEKKERWKVFLG